MTISPDSKLRLSLRDYLLHAAVLIAWTAGAVLWIDRRFAALEYGKSRHDEQLAAVVETVTEQGVELRSQDRRISRLER